MYVCVYVEHRNVCSHKYINNKRTRGSRVRRDEEGGKVIRTECKCSASSVYVYTLGDRQLLDQLVVNDKKLTAIITNTVHFLNHNVS